MKRRRGLAEHYVLILVVLSFLGLVSLLPVIATQVTVTNVEPSLYAVSLTNTTGASVTTVVPGETYNVNFTVCDNNRLDDLTSIVVMIYYNNYTVPNKSNHYNFTWLQTSNSWTSDPPGYIVSSVNPTDFSAACFYFALGFKLDESAMLNTSTIWHGQITATDSAGNLATNASITFTGRTPPQPSNLRATLNENGSITLTWTPPDAPGIASYSIYSSSNATLSTFNFSIPNATIAHPASAWTDAPENVTATPERYYIVRTKSTEGVEEPNTNTVGKFTIPLYAIDEWNLVSIPLEPHDTSPASFFSHIANNSSIIWVYNASESKPWEKYIPPAPPPASTLKGVDQKRGFWVKMKRNDTLIVTGSVPVATSINLKRGWNMIGYPSTTSKPIDIALSSINGSYNVVYAYNATDTGDHWKHYDPSLPPFFNDLQDMLPGSGYWINITSDCTLGI
jgi:hypothetical protein